MREQRFRFFFLDASFEKNFLHHPMTAAVTEKKITPSADEFSGKNK